MRLNIMILAIVIFGILTASAASAATIDFVKLNGDELSASGTNAITGVDRGDEFDLSIKVTGDNDTMSDSQIEASIAGIHNNDVTDITDTFDIRAGVSYVKHLKLTLPDDMDQDSYKLRVRLEDRNGDTVEEDYDLSISAVRNQIIIRDVIFSPADSVQAGRSLLATVRLKNLGDKDEDGIKVLITMPDLGISAADYIDTLDSDKSTSSQELYLRIPLCAVPDDYNAKVTVTYDNGAKTVTAAKTVTVTKDPTCGATSSGGQQPPSQQTVISVPTSQRLEPGKGVVYPVTITNNGAEAKTYSLMVSGIDAWGTSRLDPSNVITVAAGSSGTALVYVTAKDDASAGSYTFGLTVTSGSESKVVNMEAVVQPAQSVASSGWENVRKGLWIALIILLVILVILGLILLFNKLRREDEEGEEDVKGQTYY